MEITPHARTADKLSWVRRVACVDGPFTLEEEDGRARALIWVKPIDQVGPHKEENR